MVFPSRRPYDVCHDCEDDCRVIEIAGMIRSFSILRRPTRQFERRTLSMGMVGPGNRLSFMTIRDLSRSIAMRDTDAASKRLVWVTDKEVTNKHPYRHEAKPYTSQLLCAIHRPWPILTLQGRRRRGCFPVFSSTTDSLLLAEPKASFQSTIAAPTAKSETW